METHRSAPLKERHFSPAILGKLLVIALTVASLIFLSRLFAIKTIVCTAGNVPCNAETLEKLKTLYGKSLFFTNFKPVFDLFQDEVVTRKLPNTLLIKIAAEDYEEYQIVDGRIEPSNEKKLEESLNLEINELLAKLKKNNLEFTKIELIKEIYIIYFGENLRALVKSGDLEEGIYKLTTIRKNLDLKTVDLNLKEIDTRFKLPVLKTEFTVI